MSTLYIFAGHAHTGHYLQLRQLSYAIGKYRLGDPTGVQTAATALVVLSRKIHPAYVEVIRKFYRAPGSEDSARRNDDRAVVKNFVTALSHFVSAVAHLVELCAQDEKADGPHREMKTHLKVCSMTTFMLHVLTLPFLRSIGNGQSRGYAKVSAPH